MPVSAGDFNATKLGDIAVMSDKIFNDPTQKNTYLSDVPALRAIVENQTSKFQNVLDENGGRCRDIILKWMTDYALTVTDCEPAACELTPGPQNASDKKVYTPAKCDEVKFTVNKSNCNDVETNEKIARGLLQAKNKLRETINQKAIAWLNANATATPLKPMSTRRGAGEATGVITYTPTVWDDVKTVVPDILRVAKHNGLGNMVLLNGDNLYDAAINSQYNLTGGCCNVPDNGKIFGLINKMYFDTEKLESVVGQNASFIFDANKVVFVNDYIFDNFQPLLLAQSAKQQGYRIPDDLIPNLFFDVIFEPTCDASGRVIADTLTFKVMASYDFFTAPQISWNNTGIIKLINA